MAFCPKCGTQNNEGSCFCVRCGAVIALPPQDGRRTWGISKYFPWMILIFVALLLGLLLGALGMRWLMNRQEIPAGPAGMQNSTSEPAFTQPPADNTVPEKNPEEMQPQETVAQTLPQETEPSETVPLETTATEPEILAYCNACKSWRTDVENWMCPDCAKEGGKCSQCGERVSKLEDGLCAQCQPQEETAACAYCGEEFPRSQLHEETGLCEACSENVVVCKGCGKLTDDHFEGYCTECEPWGGADVPEESCVRCGKPSYELVNGVCPDCAELEVLSFCQACKMWSTGVKDGLCAICAREGGKCSQCGQLVSKLKDGICARCGSEEELVTCAYCHGEFLRSEVDEASGLCGECSWFVGVCQGCGKLSADLLEGYCPACAPGSHTEDPEESCSLCGTPSQDLVDGVCPSCAEPAEATDSETEPTDAAATT